MTIKEFSERVHAETVEWVKRNYPSLDAEREARVVIHNGRKYTRVDVGGSGKYMIDEAGNIYGIKAYGVPHFGHRYGTLETVDQYYWGGYVGAKK